jgi:hypothetical protein
MGQSEIIEKELKEKIYLKSLEHFKIISIEKFNNIKLNYLDIRNKLLDLSFKVDIIKLNLNDKNNHLNHLNHLNYLEERKNFNKLRELNEKNKLEYDKLKESNLIIINYKDNKMMFSLYASNENTFEYLSEFFYDTYKEEYKKIKLKINKNL